MEVLDCWNSGAANENSGTFVTPLSYPPKKDQRLLLLFVDDDFIVDWF